ncbi:hypothetical protein V5O48_006357 [Marasmius crinis-equi]|uniref:Uncharacterized protein n=1 Tax=Marasmius crinis-equi TaxID=585013 RepID=A0ABR3FJS1_9AGAR
MDPKAPPRLYIMSSRQSNTSPTGHVKFEYVPGGESHDTGSDWKTLAEKRGSLTSVDSNRGPPSNDDTRFDWWMLAYMLFFTVLGVVMAASHHAYFSSLHLHPAEDTNTQRRASLGATAFIFLVKMFFTLSIVKAFDQRVWVSVQQRFMKLKGLDALFSAPHNPFAFLSFDMMSNAKVATLMVAVVWLLPFAVVPLPGALTIQPRNDFTSANVLVPHINLLNDPADGALAIYDQSLIYQRPSPSMQTLATRALVSNSVPSWPNPCPDSSLSCSYRQRFFAPSFNCSAPQNTTVATPDLTRWSSVVGTGPQSDVLNVTWVSNPNGTLVSTTSCTSYNSTYEVRVRFRGGRTSGSGPEVELDRIRQQDTFGTANPANWTGFSSSNPSGGNPSGQAFLAAIKDAVATSLAGNIFVDPNVGVVVPDSTLVMLSPSLPVFNGTGNNLFFRPDANTLIQDILTNTTLSLLSMNLWNTNVQARVESSRNVFVYDSSVLWIGYGISLALTLIMVAIGVYSAWINGGSRDTNFSTVVRTSRNRVLDRYMELREHGMSQKAFERDFLELRLRYGLLAPDQAEGNPTKKAFGIETQMGKD